MELENQELFALAGELGVQECFFGKWQYSELLVAVVIMYSSP